MTSRNGMLLAAFGSAVMLAGAYAFQHFGGMAPCKLCLWQRWPHGAAALIGVIVFFVPSRGLAVLGALAALTTAAIGFYHAGVELSFWEGPTTCTSGSIAELSTDQLMDQILSAPLVQCDDIAWSLFGISMAGWNGLISTGLAGLWAMAFRRSA